MEYISTRGQDGPLGYEQALLSGLARDGGLYLPVSYPRFGTDEIRAMAGLSYAELAGRIMARFTPGGVGQGEDGGGGEGGIFRPGDADGEGHDGYAGGHLNDGEEGVLPAERLGLDRDAEDGQWRHGGGHAGQVGGSASSGDDHLEAARFGCFGIFIEPAGCAVSADDFCFVGNLKLLKQFCRFAHRAPIGLAAHDNTDKWLVLIFTHAPREGNPRQNSTMYAGHV